MKKVEKKFTEVLKRGNRLVYNFYITMTATVFYEEKAIFSASQSASVASPNLNASTSEETNPPVHDNLNQAMILK